MHVIVPAVAEDAATILAIQKRAFAEEARLCDDPAIPPLTEPLAAVIGHIATATVLVARIGTQVVGSIRGLAADAVCTIRALSIAPEQQGRGIGSELLSAIERAHPHVARFELMTNAAMASNVRFYQGHGYRITALQQHSGRILLACMSKAAVAEDVPGPSPLTNGAIAAVLIHVSDVGAGLAWYERAFPQAERRRIESPDFECLAVGDVTIELVPADAKVQSGTAGSVVYWRVADFDRALEHFERSGATLHRGPMTIEGGRRMCQVRDPWGNCIGLRGPGERGLVF